MTQRFKLVVLESPFAPIGTYSTQCNIEFARACVKDCLSRGESAYASHLFFTQEGILDDTIPAERELGINAGFAWRTMAEKTVVYIDHGVSFGMWKGIFHAQELMPEGHLLEFRYLNPPKQ